MACGPVTFTVSIVHMCTVTDLEALKLVLYSTIFVLEFLLGHFADFHP